MNTWRSATGRAATRRCCWSACHSGGSAADGGGKQRQQHSGGDGGSLGGSFGGRKQETRCRPVAVRESRVSKPTAALTNPTLGSVRPALLMPADVGGEQMACSWSPGVQTAAAAYAGLGHCWRCADHACVLHSSRLQAAGPGLQDYACPNCRWYAEQQLPARGARLPPPPPRRTSQLRRMSAGKPPRPSCSGATVLTALAALCVSLW
jgi:hypothetical protein